MMLIHQLSSQQNLTIEAIAKQIHLELLRNIKINLEGAKVGIEIEYLHNLRVTIRKIRSALTLIPDVFSQQELQHFKEEFKWLQQVTSQVRDLDVHLVYLQKYQQGLTIDQITALQSIIQTIKQQRTYAQIDMNEAFNSTRLSRLLSGWEKLLTINNKTNKHDLTTHHVANIINYSLRKLYKKIIQHGRMIHHHSSNEDLHDMRKRCKKLRYMLEFFHHFYDINAIKHLIKLIKHLTDELGICQDLAVQKQLIITIQTKMLIDNNDNNLQLDTQLILTNLLTNVQQNYETSKLKFIQIFTTLDNACERNLFRILLNSNSISH
jgi:CHAD domain-containing protein